MTEPRKLTLKQQRFVAEYLIDGNGTRAAIAAGYSKNVAAVQATENLKKPNIASAIAAKTQKQLGKLELSVERILQERARLALFDIGDAAGAQLSGPQDIANLPDHIRQAVTGWKWDKAGNFVLQFADKNPHLTALEKIHGMYAPDEGGDGALSIHIHL